MTEIDWDEHARGGWDANESVREYSKAAFASLLRTYAELGVSLEGIRALDFGCGTGLLTEQLAAVVREVVAVDTAREMIAVLEAKQTAGALDNVSPLYAEVTPELLKTNTLFKVPFDLVVCSSVCAFLDDYPSMVSSLAARLRPGGMFVQWDWALDPEDEDPFGLTRDEIHAALSGAGLKAVHVDAAFTIETRHGLATPLMGTGVL